MTDFFSHSLIVLPLLGAVICLSFLTFIDLKIRLLPNSYVLAFALFGLAFHALQGFERLSPEDMARGLIVGGGLLYIVRTIANRIYNQDTLGLGDVKLMAAAGLWLGAQGVLNALIIGACAGIVHGLIIYFIEKPESLSRLALPAGPGFIFGIIASGLIKFLL